MTQDISELLKKKLSTASTAVSLESQKVGPGLPTYFIAEIGNNHNGDFYLAKRSIEEAARSGAHAVKFQKRSIPDVFAKELRDKPHKKGDIKGDTYGEYREGLELTIDELTDLKGIAASNKVSFFVTPFDIPSVDVLEKIDVPFYKVSSFDVTNLPLLDYIAQKGKPIILSTGMATIEEVDEAVLTVLKHNPNLILLHCVSVYPSPDEHINLGAMLELNERYPQIPVGYSGHEKGFLPTLTAITLGAAVVERHFTLSNRLPGPDHGSVSIEPDEFLNMVKDAERIRNIAGSGDKRLLEEEKTTRDKHSKSIIAKIAISKGTTITEEMLMCKSPGYGLKPRELPSVIGKRAAVDIDQDAVLQKDSVLWG